MHNAGEKTQSLLRTFASASGGSGNSGRKLHLYYLLVFITLAPLLTGHGRLVAAEAATYSSRGYPEDKKGQLVWQTHANLGRVTFLKASSKAARVLYQVKNRQRDAIFLARGEELTDNLPDGRSVVIPRGMGAVKFNTALVSGVEGQEAPHFADNIKEYEKFTITDLMLGAGFGIMGPEADVRLVIKDTWSFYSSAGWNMFSGLAVSGLFGSFSTHAGIGAGGRFLAPIRLPFPGNHYWGGGIDMRLGFGDADEDGLDETVFMPGIYAEISQCLYGDKTKARSGGKPYNYNVTEIFLRVGAHFNTGESEGSMSISLTAGLRFNLFGSIIPAHAKKKTVKLYTDPEYEQQKAAEKRAIEQR